MNAQKQRARTQHDPAMSRVRACRVSALKDLIEKSVYDVPSEDVAASIMSAVIVVAPMPPKPR
jgi:anti-sigma28 factor (negative regulator of flagellin synthesis)